MSYPPYQQAPDGNQPPYPQQGGGMPYPSYPSGPYPPQQGVFPPSLGMPMNTPMYMPTPYGNAAPTPYPPYSGGAPGYPPAPGGYAPPTGAPGYAPPSGAPGYALPTGASDYAPPTGTPGYAPPTGAPGYAPPSTNYPPPHQGGGYVPPANAVPVYPGVTGAVHIPGNTHGAPSTEIKYTPTLVPAQPFDPRADAEVLRKAMKGFGTDEKAIIGVVGKRTNAQRLQIAIQFKTLYGKDLVKDFKSEATGKFEDLLVALMTPLPTFYAKELHHAISGIGTNEETLIEIMCSMTNNEIRCITAAYQSLYYRPLEEDLRGDTSGTFKRLLVSLCTAGRDESQQVNTAQATADAQSLLGAGALRWGTDESTFNMIMCSRSYPHLRCVFDEYKRISGKDIEEAVKSEFSGNSEDGMLAIVRSVRNRPAFYAKMLHESVRGLGTNDRQLIRLVATRCEVDMEDVKKNYQAKYGESLKDAISGDASGDYKKLLLCLIGEY